MFLASVFCLICSTRIGIVGANRVLLRDITSLTLRRGEYTSGRRSSPVPQLECVGGTAYGKFAPKVVQCYNRGWDGRDVQWECKAEMNKDYQFGSIDVSCEGYDYSNDPYILAGSCGLRYELDFSSIGAKRQTFGDYVSYPSGRPWFKFENIVYILAILFIMYILYLMFWQGAGTAGGANRRPGGGGGGYPPDDAPPPPGWNNPPPPPSYDDSCGGSGAGGGSGGRGSGGPGFFSGLGLGALGGYLWGRNPGYDSEYRYRRPHTSSYDQYDSGGHYGGGGYGGSSPSTSSSTHTSSGFGGTSRR
uniref:Store-operated calcium entry-associated regulatory factor n=1 Tax=Globodera rostochiensis TaxID=31243 RepID=A0A914HXJ4_GLORO